MPNPFRHVCFPTQQQNASAAELLGLNHTNDDIIKELVNSIGSRELQDVESKSHQHVQSWPKKFVLGCVIQQAESRNLGLFWPTLYITLS